MTTLTLPSTNFSAIDLDPEHVIAQSRARGGWTSEVRSSDPIWLGSFTTTPLTERELRAWEAFVSEATERMLPFDFLHPTKRVPSAYTLSTLPFGGAATTDSVADLTTPKLAGLPLGLVLRAGDRVSAVEGDYVAHRMVAADLVVASETSQAVRLTPRLPLGLFTTAAVFNFKDPLIRLRVAKNTWRCPLRAGEPMIGSFDVYEAQR